MLYLYFLICFVVCIYTYYSLKGNNKLTLIMHMFMNFILVNLLLLLISIIYISIKNFFGYYDGI